MFEEKPRDPRKVKVMHLGEDGRVSGGVEGKKKIPDQGENLNPG